ncbi:MAG: helix-turn-helix domain-containing protein [Oscillospiraceae bacterium]|nr:helix-turn-helix domain-containing protein [Oscillospiraceae bacterium]
MELGEKLLCARLEAGLSQRQLCGEEITRNMLSQIEHGTARPSMSTLRYLAGRLGKPVSYFLEEDAVVSSNQNRMAQARRALDEGNYAIAAETLKQYRGPDGVYDREKALLDVLARLGMGETAAAEGRQAYARQLLTEPVPEGVYCAPELERRRVLLLEQVQETVSPLCARLPSLDGELILRARAALENGEGERAAALLDAAENQDTAQWQLLKGRAWLLRENYAEAAQCFHAAEEACPEETAPLLEQCYREMQDFKRAYEYACKRRGSSK